MVRICRLQRIYWTTYEISLFKTKQLGIEIWRWTSLITLTNKLFSTVYIIVSGIYILLFIRKGCLMGHFSLWSLFVCCTVQINTSRNKYSLLQDILFDSRFHNHWFTCTWGCVNPKWQRQNCILLNNCTLCNTMQSP